jgi:hypothetical protein
MTLPNVVGDVFAERHSVLRGELLVAHVHDAAAAQRGVGL